MREWHRAHGGDVSRTARHFGVSRPTVYRWLARYDRRRLESLEDRLSRPRRRRRPTWSDAEVEGVRALRERYLRWGKDKLAVLIEAEGVSRSAGWAGSSPGSGGPVSSSNPFAGRAAGGAGHPGPMPCASPGACASGGRAISWSSARWTCAPCPTTRCGPVRPSAASRPGSPSMDGRVTTRRRPDIAEVRGEYRGA
jgi:transposase-like protein